MFEISNKFLAAKRDRTFPSQRFECSTIPRSFPKSTNLAKVKAGPYDTHGIFSKQIIANKNASYEHVPRPKWERIDNLESREEVLVVQNIMEEQRIS